MSSLVCMFWIVNVSMCRWICLAVVLLLSRLSVYDCVLSFKLMQTHFALALEKCEVQSFVSELVSLSGCLSTRPLVCIPAGQQIGMPACLSSSLSACLSVSLTDRQTDRLTGITDQQSIHPSYSSSCPYVYPYIYLSRNMINLNVWLSVCIWLSECQSVSMC